MTLFTGNISTISAGQTAGVSTALATYRDPLKALSEAWTTFTHGWSGTLGNGTIVAKYLRVNKLVIYRIQLTWGSTTSHPASAQLFNFPVTPHGDYSNGMHVGNGAGLDFGTTWNQFAAFWNTSTTLFLLTTANTQVTNTVPWTWANGDKLSLDGFYETA